MNDFFPINLQDQISAVRREIAMRAKVYPRWIASGKLKAETAEHETRAMEAVLETLLKLKAAGG